MNTDPTIDIKNIKYDFTNYMIKEINIIITPGNTFTVKYDEKTRIYDILSVNQGTSDPVTNVQLTNAPGTIVKAKTTPGNNTPVITTPVNTTEGKTAQNKTTPDINAEVKNVEVKTGPVKNDQIINSEDVNNSLVDALDNKNDSLIYTQTFTNSTDLIKELNGFRFTHTQQSV